MPSVIVLSVTAPYLSLHHRVSIQKCLSTTVNLQTDNFCSKLQGFVHNTSFSSRLKNLLCATMLVPGKPLHPYVMKHACLLDLTIRYDDNEVLLMWTRVLNTN